MRAEDLEPLEIEPLSRYDVYTNDDNEVLIMVPGYYKGEPQICELLYNGGENAVLVRNRHQLILCDKVHEEVRKWLYRCEEVLIGEADTKREYMAKVVHDEGIDRVAARAAELHDYYFPLHPFPLQDGTFDTGEERCEYCGKTVPIHFRALTARGYRKTICPGCIRQGEPGLMGDSLFPELDDACSVRARADDKFRTTPPYLDRGGPARLWAAHCDRPAVYLGALEPEDLIPELKEAIEETWDNEFNVFRDEDPETAWQALEEGSVTAHLFRCAACSGSLCIFYRHEE